MDLRGIANRCDYRAKVTVDPNECRDANEDHAGGRMGSGFLYGFDGPSCPRSADGQRVAYTREPADEMCWEILNFGIPDDGDNDPSITESSTGPCTGAGSATGGSCQGQGNFSGVNAGPYVRPDGIPTVTFGPQITFTYPPEPTQPVGGGSGNGNGNSGEESGDGEEETEGEESGDGEEEPESETPQVIQSTSTCQAGRYLRDANECRIAAESIGIEYVQSINRQDRPVGCYSRNNRAWFNRASQGTGSADRLSICCASDNCAFDESDEDDDDEEEASGDSENRYVQSSSGSCQEGTSYITQQDQCHEAAEEIGLELHTVFSNSLRPRMLC